MCPTITHHLIIIKGMPLDGNDDWERTVTLGPFARFLNKYILIRPQNFCVLF